MKNYKKTLISNGYDEMLEQDNLMIKNLLNTDFYVLNNCDEVYLEPTEEIDVLLKIIQS